MGNNPLLKLPLPLRYSGMRHSRISPNLVQRAGCFEYLSREQINRVIGRRVIAFARVPDDCVRGLLVGWLHDYCTIPDVRLRIINPMCSDALDAHHRSS